MRNLTLIRGLPGSGKSTLAKALQALYGAKHYEADQYFMKDGEYRFDGNRISDAHDWCQQMTYEALNEGHHVIVSNTFTKLRELRPYYDIALGFKILPHVILSQSNYGSVHGVPDSVLENMKNRFHFDLSEINTTYKKMIDESESEGIIQI